MAEKPVSRNLGGQIARPLISIVQFLVVLATVCIAAGFFGRFHFVLDLFSHFRPHAGISLVVGGGVLIVAKRKWRGITALGLGLILLLTLTLYFVPKNLGVSKTSKRLLVLNVLTSNPKKVEVADFLRKENPDFFILLETNQEWVTMVVSEFESDYPYHHEVPRGDNFGICMFSKIPFRSIAVAEWGDDFLPSIDAQFEDPKAGAYRIIGTHPLPPMNSDRWRSRNTQFREVAEAVSKLSVPTLVAGDFNSSPWSPWFKDFMKTGGLRDSALGFGIPPTWQAGNSPIFRLHLDHICVSERIAIHDRKVGPDVGSDHRAVIVDFTIE